MLLAAALSKADCIRSTPLVAILVTKGADSQISALCTVACDQFNRTIVAVVVVCSGTDAMAEFL
jgi:hypothetical protein